MEKRNWNFNILLSQHNGAHRPSSKFCNTGFNHVEPDPVRFIVYFRFLSCRVILVPSSWSVALDTESDTDTLTSRITATSTTLRYTHILIYTSFAFCSHLGSSRRGHRVFQSGLSQGRWSHLDESECVCLSAPAWHLQRPSRM